MRALGVTLSKARMGGACLTRGVVGRGRRWGLEAEGGWPGLKNARLGSRREISGEAGRSAAGGEGSHREESFTVREKYLHLLTYLAPEVLTRCARKAGSEASLPRKRRKKAVTHSLGTKLNGAPCGLGWDRSASFADTNRGVSGAGGSCPEPRKDGASGEAGGTFAGLDVILIDNHQ